MTDHAEPIQPSNVPSIVHRLNPFVARMLRLGVPMGPNVLITIRGRTSGEPRTFPVAILHADGRRFLFSPFGEVQWVKNLRSSREAAIGRGPHPESVAAHELDVDSAARTLEAGLRPVLRVPVMGPMIAGWYGITRDSTPADYLSAAERHPAFELRALEAGLRPVLRVPVMGPMIAGWYGITRDSTPADYLAAAGRHPAFELRALEDADRA